MILAQGNKRDTEGKYTVSALYELAIQYGRIKCKDCIFLGGVS